MILDTSVLVAIALAEPEHVALESKIDSAATVAVGSPTLVEAGIVISARTGRDARAVLGDIVANIDATVVEFGVDHFREALSAWLRFGEGRHPAALNFGDCLSYAVARVSGQPLLSEGRDFALTDLTLA